jgi:very-short-patch-repair endonuclease
MRPSNGVLRHEVRHRPAETTVRKGIPVTTLRRTIVDIAAQLSVEGIEAAVREAQYRHGLDPGSVGRLLLEYRGYRGIAKLRTCLDNLDLGPTGRTRSPLEDRVASMLARTEIRQPELNVLLEIGGELIEADLLWRKEKVIVEIDGRDEHSTDAAFQADRVRDRRLQGLGWRVGRVTGADVRQPEMMLTDIRTLLAIASRERAQPAISRG